MSKGAHVTGIRLIVCVAAVLINSGCASLQEVRFVVEPSGLDYVQFVSHKATGQTQRHTVKVELQGSGHLTYSAGTSDRARSGFWRPSDAPNWDDVQSDRLVLPEATTIRILQRVVDAGAFDRGRHRSSPESGSSGVLVQARIGREKSIFKSDDTAFVTIANDLIKCFAR